MYNIQKGLIKETTLITFDRSNNNYVFYYDHNHTKLDLILYDKAKSNLRLNRHDARKLEEIFSEPEFNDLKLKTINPNMNRNVENNIDL